MDNSAIMFDTEKEFLEWISVQATPQLSISLKKLDAEEVTSLYQTYNENVDMKDDYGMKNFLGMLGRSIPDFMELVQKTKNLKLGKIKKEFVIENVLLLSRLIDNGITGKEDNINKETEGFEMLSEKVTSLQDEVVRPQVDQALEGVFQLWKDLDSMKRA